MKDEKEFADQLEMLLQHLDETQTAQIGREIVFELLKGKTVLSDVIVLVEDAGHRYTMAMISWSAAHYASIAAIMGRGTVGMIVEAHMTAAYMLGKKAGRDEGKEEIDELKKEIAECPRLHTSELDVD